MKRKIGQFIAADENGRRYTILIYTNIMKAGTFENPNKEVEGIGELKAALRKLGRTEVKKLLEAKASE